MLTNKQLTMTALDKISRYLLRFKGIIPVMLCLLLAGCKTGLQFEESLFSGIEPLPSKHLLGEWKTLGANPKDKDSRHSYYHFRANKEDGVSWICPKESGGADICAEDVKLFRYNGLLFLEYKNVEKGYASRYYQYRVFYLEDGAYHTPAYISVNHDLELIIERSLQQCMREKSCGSGFQYTNTGSWVNIFNRKNSAANQYLIKILSSPDLLYQQTIIKIVKSKDNYFAGITGDLDYADSIGLGVMGAVAILGGIAKGLESLSSPPERSSSSSSSYSSESHGGLDKLIHGDRAFSDTWTPICNDGSFGTVSLINSSICASSSTRASKCLAQNEWTAASAREYICR
jgi:hypothetical protein